MKWYILNFLIILSSLLFGINTSYAIIIPEMQASPVIDNVSKSIITDGETVRINGKNFGADRDVSYVDFNGVSATDYSKWTDTIIIVIVPPEITDGQITVWVKGVQSNGKNYTYQKKFKLLETVLVKGGTFMMGDESGTGFDNVPAHQVTITNDFEISVTEISQKDWKLVMDGSNPSHPTDTGDAKPVQQVTFQRAAEFCNRLSQLEGYIPVYTIDQDNVTWDTRQTGYRLPTEAEWEYAARAGRTNAYTNEEIQEMGWVSENSANHSKPVGQKKANDWGIYDMFGNIAEWCWDYYDSEFYGKSPSSNPVGPIESPIMDRIIRGGSFVNGADMCNIILRSSYPGTTNNFSYYLGLRVVRNKIGMDVENSDNKSTIFISPNPASDFIEISVPNVILSEAKDLNFNIYDVLGVGQNCMDSRLRGNDNVFAEGKIRIDISHLSQGIYFVRIWDVVKKFVKY